MSHWQVKILMKLLAMTSLCVACGCAEPTTGTVTGTITVDGDFPQTGYIGFTATDGKTGPVGTEIIDGQYTAEVPLGEVKIDIRVPKVVGKTKLYNTPDSPIQEVTEESLPPRYNDETELVETIVAGETTKDFELTTKRSK